MIEDRDYMRAQSDRSGPFRTLPAWLALLGLNVIVFVVQNAVSPQVSQSIYSYGALSLDGLQHGFIWQLLTFQFLHGGLGHLALNSFALYAFGRALEMSLGRRNFLGLYLVSGLAGGVVQVLLGLTAARFGGAVVGASAGLCGLVAAFALLNPQEKIHVFFVLPVKAIYVLPVLLAMTVACIVFPTGDRIAYGAHLGGILAGCAWIKLGWHHDYQLPWANLVSRWRWWKPLKSRQRKRELVRAASVRGGPWRTAPEEPVEELPRSEFISKEVDPILEKISAHGIHSLTDRERKVLEKARQKMGSR